VTISYPFRGKLLPFGGITITSWGKEKDGIGITPAALLWAPSPGGKEKTFPVEEEKKEGLRR